MTNPDVDGLAAELASVGITYERSADGDSASVITLQDIARNLPRPVETDSKLNCVKCGKPGTQKCSRCKSVYYCSSTCQRGDWKVHKKTCRDVDAPMSEAMFMGISRAAEQAGKAGRYRQEILMYKNLIRRSPNQISSYANLALALLRVGDFEKSAAYAGKVLRMLDSGVTAGLSAVLGEDRDHMRAMFDQVVGMTGQIVDQLRRRKLNVVVPLAAKLAETTQKHAARYALPPARLAFQLYLLGDVQKDFGDAAGAKATFRECLRVYPADAAAADKLAEMALMEGIQAAKLPKTSTEAPSPESVATLKAAVDEALAIRRSVDALLPDTDDNAAFSKIQIASVGFNGFNRDPQHTKTLAGAEEAVRYLKDASRALADAERIIAEREARGVAQGKNQPDKTKAALFAAQLKPSLVSLLGSWEARVAELKQSSS